ncbi:MAG: lysophospholipid acyltransferase family protein [Bacteroidetes bacterium]|nr:lysophospholipid acyltransferase family protein [Bacteroidota bacterium]
MNIFPFLLYYLVLVPVSCMPFFFLHGIARVMYFFLYPVFGYRKKVVKENLCNAFPDRSEKERKEIARKFYLFLGDLLLEGFKSFTISEKTLHRRLHLSNPELAEKYFAKNKSVIIAIGHYNSWEMFLAGIDSFMKHKVYIIYQPLSNKFFDRKLRETRSEHGTIMLPAKEVKKFFAEKQKEPTATIFAIDQSPSSNKNCYWMKFLNQETGILFGTEKFSKETGQPVLYARINKVRRGYYSLDLTLVTDDPKSTAYGEITEKVTRLLEKDIIAQPEYWLWSHKRWKHKREISETKKKS